LLLAAAPLSLSNPPATGSDGFTIDLPNPEADVVAVVQSVVEDHVIRGTYVYEREKTLNGAVSQASSNAFGSQKVDGRVFYKVRKDALAPRNFKDSSDIGIITVRYLVRPLADGKTHLEILAIFVEDGTRRAHISDSTVETNEFSEIQKQLDALQRHQQEVLEFRQKKDTEAAEAAALAEQNKEENGRYQAAESSVKTLEQRANELQHAVEVRISNSSTELKSAPFRSATTLTKLPGDSDVLVEIITDYWYGIETSDGQRGWVRRDQVTPLP
jgi:hypothetical protein